MTRQQKTPRQRAEEQLAVAQRLAKRLQARCHALTEELEGLRQERDAAFARRDYLAQHPDLKQQTTPTTQGETAP